MPSPRSNPRRPGSRRSHTRAAAAAPSPVQVDTTGRVHLDWRDSSHWSSHPASCVHCGRNTNLRDDDGEPAHKTCAEAELAAELAAAARTAGAA